MELGVHARLVRRQRREGTGDLGAGGGREDLVADDRGVGPRAHLGGQYLQHAAVFHVLSSAPEPGWALMVVGAMMGATLLLVMQRMFWLGPPPATPRHKRPR